MSVIRYFQPRMKERLMRGEVPPWLARHPRSKYIIQSILSFPPWTDREELKRIKRNADLMEMTIDHIVPLSHPYVCGLGVPWNLRIIPASPNFSKGNRWSPSQLELFANDPPQLALDLSHTFAVQN